MFPLLSRKTKRERQRNSLVKIKVWFLIFHLGIGRKSSPGPRSAKEPEKRGSHTPHAGVPTTSGTTNPAVSTHHPDGSKPKSLSHSDNPAGNGQTVAFRLKQPHCACLSCPWVIWALTCPRHAGPVVGGGRSRH